MSVKLISIIFQESHLVNKNNSLRDKALQNTEFVSKKSYIITLSITVAFIKLIYTILKIKIKTKNRTRNDKQRTQTITCVLREQRIRKPRS